jgi:hypothetical protein
MKTFYQLTSLLFALMLTSCFTLHKPAYLVSELDMPNPQNAYRKTGSASANYFLLFGGNKKDRLMSAARADLWANLNGAQDLQIANVVVDESKTVVLLVYARHTLTIEADFFPTPAFRDTAAFEVESRSKKIFFSGDRVAFNHICPPNGEKRQVIGTIHSPESNMILLDKSQFFGQDTIGDYFLVPEFTVKLLTVKQAQLTQGTKVSFNPINRRGNYFEGTVVSTKGDYDVWVELTPEYAEKWYGENQPHGNRIVHVPSYRIKKL